MEFLCLILVGKALIWLLGLILVRKALFSLESIGVLMVKCSFFQILGLWRPYKALIRPSGSIRAL